MPDVKLPDRTVHVYLNGEQPDGGREWCATCVMVYMGASMNDAESTDKLKAIIAAHPDLDYLVFELPVFPKLILYYAVTTAPSWMFPQLGNMPVCWNHVMAHGRSNQNEVNERTSTLIRGKKHGTVTNM